MEEDLGVAEVALKRSIEVPLETSTEVMEAMSPGPLHILEKTIPGEEVEDL